MNKLKKIFILIPFLLLYLSVSSCSKQYFYSGVSENVFQELLSTYQFKNYTKKIILSSLGAPLVIEDNGDLWIYSSSKDHGNETFKKKIYNKTLKLYFLNSILYDIKEISL